MLLRFNILFALLLSCLLGANAAVYSVESLPNVQVADATRYLVNPDHIVSQAVSDQIDALLRDAREKSSAEIVAVIVDDIDSDDVDDFATRLFNTWGLGNGQNNNGILLLVVKDKRSATIRTGYGAEGVLPDALANKIVTKAMFPKLRQNDFDGAMLGAVNEIHSIVTADAAQEELRHHQNGNYANDDQDNPLHYYLIVAGLVAVALLAWLGYMVYDINSRKKPMSDYQKCQYLKKYQLAFWVLSLLFMGIPILAPILMMLLRRHYRNHPRNCPRCGTKMQKLSEEEDNKYLNYAQDLEERIRSVDYDVWLCPACGEKDIYSFENSSSNYKKCARCKAKTEKLTGTRIINEPTYDHEGMGEKQYSCLNCGNHRKQPYTIERKRPNADAMSLAVGATRAAGRLGRGGFGGGFGGIRGGGFGGGRTGGGGVTRRW